MINFYFNMAPNPCKVALLLEELGLPYNPIPIDTRKGEQHEASFLALNANAKVPVIVEDGVVVFDSSAILIYLAEKAGQFAPSQDSHDRAAMFSWMMFIASGLGPFTGQCIHFKHYAPVPKRYALNRYDFEAWRHWQIVNEHLKTQRYMVGNVYSIVDMALWGWCRPLTFALGDDAWARLPHVRRLFEEINGRSAAQRVEQLRSKYSFKTEMDDEARAALFPQNARLTRVTQGAV